MVLLFMHDIRLIQFLFDDDSVLVVLYCVVYLCVVYSGSLAIRCSSSTNGRGPKDEEKRRAELSARIASGEFTVEKARYGRKLYSVL